MNTGGAQSAGEHAVRLSRWRAFVVTYVLTIVTFGAGMWSLRHFFIWIRNWGH